MNTQIDTTEHAQLWQFFKDEGVSLEEVSERTGYSFGYIFNLVQGYTPMNDKIRFRIMRAYPQAASLFGVTESSNAAEAGSEGAGPAEGVDDV